MSPLLYIIPEIIIALCQFFLMRDVWFRINRLLLLLLFLWSSYAFVAYVNVRGFDRSNSPDLAKAGFKTMQFGHWWLYANVLTFIAMMRKQR